MPKPRARRVLNEAAHKLDPWAMQPRARPSRSPPEPSGGGGGAAVLAPPPSSNRTTQLAPGSKPAAPAPASDRDRAPRKEAPAPPSAPRRAGLAVLALGALGVVYGDLGTSPLYTEQATFTAGRVAPPITRAGVYGIASLIFWALVLEPSIKYAIAVMHADNDGDGGIMALAAIIQRLIRRRALAGGALLVTLGIFGAGLFFGDGMITPTITVLSSIEGLSSVSASFTHLEIPIALAILIALFAAQRLGTHAVGWLFGPVMLLWFAVIAVLGGHQVLLHPDVLQGLSPAYGLRYLLDHGVDGFLVLGFVVLATTGAEAMYADMGHFGPGAIRLAWFAIVLPGVVLNYLGQAALIRAHPSTVVNPFYLVVPHWGRLAMVFLATAAAIIASQAVISGSYSVARQAVQLGWLPRLGIVHTSKRGMEGQIYVPAVNWILCVGVVALVLIFQHSIRLANAYGMAVTATFLLNTVLFVVVARSLWRTARWKLATAVFVFGVTELAFVAANSTKIVHGGWLPLTVGLLTAVVMLTWRRGAEIVTRSRAAKEGPLQEFIEGLRRLDPPVRRVPGTGIFLHPGRETTPLALRTEVEHNHVLPERTVILYVETTRVPYVADSERFSVERLGCGQWRIIHLTARFGYREHPIVPAALRLAREHGVLAPDLDLDGASYFLSKITITPTDAPGMRRWRKRLFVLMARNAASPIDHFGLPGDRTVMVGSQIAV